MSVPNSSLLSTATQTVVEKLTLKPLSPVSLPNVSGSEHRAAIGSLAKLEQDTVQLSQSSPKRSLPSHSDEDDEKQPFRISSPVFVSRPGESAAKVTSAEVQGHSDWKSLFNVGQSVLKPEEIFTGDELALIEQLQDEQNKHEPVKYSKSDQKRLCAEYYGDGASQKGKQFNIVMGLSGSGKSSIIVDKLQRDEGALVIDSDKIKEMMPEFDHGKGAQAVHSTSASIASACLREAIKNDDNVIYPTVGSSTKGLEEFIKIAKSKGYRIKLHLAKLPPEVAAKRVFKRMAHAVNDSSVDFQFTPPQLPLQNGYEPEKNFLRLIDQGGVDEFAVWDTTVQGGKLLTRGGS
jgi:predicted ABC-type ATPase